MEEQITRIRTILDHPADYLRQWKSKNRKPVIGYFCSYTPIEIIAASGALAYRITGTKGPISLADAHLQSYSCALVRAGLEAALDGSLSFLSGAVFPHTCDSIQRLSDIWRMNAGFDMHFDMVLPVKLGPQSSRDYFFTVYQTFRDDLARVMGIHIDDEMLAASIDLSNEISDLLTQLYGIKSNDPDSIMGSDLHAILQGRTVMEGAEYRDTLAQILGSLSAKSGCEYAGSKKRLLLTGSLCTHPDIFPLIEEAGASVVWDDLCTGTRSFFGAIAGNSDPVRAIAQRYIERINCAAKHQSNRSRGENLVRLVKTQRIDGVIFMLLKFCDPYDFDYPDLKQMLDDQGVASLLLEIDEKMATDGQLRTRIETFVETLKER
jgi:bzd-type benzoyl-CoA reductase N subunit